jgi:hypothetical protein
MFVLSPFEWPRWAVMWALAALLFAACKALTRARAPRTGCTRFRHFAYLFLWPGLDAAAFLDPKPLPQRDRPRFTEWLFAVSKCALGAALIWVLVPNVPVEYPLVRGWVSMAGIVFALHFGAFHVLSCAWRAAGVNAKPLMNWPLLSASVSEFWGKRWNTAFRDLTHKFLFAPLARKFGPRRGLAVGFLFSGVVHELVITVPAGGGYGLPTLYFAVQGLGILIEKRAKLRGAAGRAFAVLVLVAPAPLLFPPPFVRGVVLPFLDALVP